MEMKFIINSSELLRVLCKRKGMGEIDIEKE
jgi:hypothetical protein